jgi:ankyrin repeat protein
MSEPRRLPANPSLEQLRKQARELLNDFRSGAPEAVAEVQRFERRPDPATFALHDAQRVLARAYGYDSWSKLKAFVDGASMARLVEAVNAGDRARVRALLAARPELIGMDTSGGNEQRALHYAVLRRDADMARMLMEAGADARQGVWPHRDATTAFALARDRGYTEIVAVIEEEERRRREEMSCPNATVSPVQDQISEAIRTGDKASAIRLLEADKTLIQACDRNGGTPLHMASAVLDEDMVRWLLDRRASPRKEDMRGLTPLDWAALAFDGRKQQASRFRTVARLLLEQRGELTIRAAVALADPDRVRELVAGDGRLLGTLDGGDGGLLALAVRHRQIEMVRLLLDLGADVDERMMLEELEEPTESWGGPLWHAARLNYFEIAKLLLDRGADPNSNVYASGWPLSNAWNHEDGSIRRLLLERGARVQPHILAENHDVDAARRLLAAESSEELARELVWSAADSGCPEIVEMTLGRLNWPPGDRQWHWVIIQPIRGFHRRRDGGEGFFTCMSILLDRIDPNVSGKGQTALHFAAAHHGDLSGPERARFAAMLVDRGARLDLRDDLLRSTPLGWACRWGRTEMVELLLRRGAPAAEPEAEPWATPMAWAEKMNRREIIELLRGAGGSQEGSRPLH